LTEGAVKWTIQTVDSAAYAGKYTSLVLDSQGNPHISYQDGQNNDLKYTEWTGAAWITSTVYSTGVVGQWSSLAFDTNNNPCISFPDSVQHVLLYAKWTGSNWDIVTVDPNSRNGQYSSLVLDKNNNPNISYQDYTNNDLKYAKWTGSAWDIQTVESTGNTGYYTSIALDGNGNPLIAYQDIGNGLLKLAKWTGSAWTIQTVDTTGMIGNTPSIAIDSKGYPHISYFNGNSKTVMYATWSGSAWTTQTVELAGAASYSSLALDSNNNPCISYTGVNADLRFAKWSGTAWNIEVVDSGGNTGMYTSLALDNYGNPCVSYHDYSNGDLKYASSTGQISITASLRVKVVDGSGNILSGATIISTTQPTGQTTLTGTSGDKDPTIFNNLVAGSYTVQASKTGYTTGSSSVTVAEAATTDVTLTLQLIPSTGDLKITVKTSTGTPLAGISVTLTTQPSGQSTLTKTCDSNGKATFSGVLPGSYTVQASKDGYNSASGTVSVTAGGVAELAITLQATPTKGDLKIIVKESSGAIISGVSVSSTSQPGGQSALSGTSASDGSVTFTGLAVGNYTLQVSKSGYVSSSVKGAVKAGAQTDLSATLQTQPSGGIPGFPFESLSLGLALVIFTLFADRKSQTRYRLPNAPPE